MNRATHFDVLQPVSNPNRLPIWLKPAIVAGISIAALTGCTAQAEAPQTTHSSSAEATPAPTASATTAPRKTGGDFERADALPAELKAANKATPEEFAKLDKGTQIKWATWAGQYKQEFITLFSTINTDPENAPYTLTANSDAKALLVDRAYEQRIAINFGEGKPSGRQYNGDLDKNMAEKYIMAFTVIDDASIARIDSFINTAGDDGQAINATQQAGTNIYDLVGETNKSQDFIANSNHMQVNGESIPCFHVSWTKADGSGSSDFNIGAYTTVNYKNEPIVVAMVSE